MGATTLDTMTPNTTTLSMIKISIKTSTITANSGKMFGVMLTVVMMNAVMLGERYNA
jgi:hypothetical protein